MAISELELVEAERTRPRARLVAVSVQMQVVMDDGETLHPLQVAPIHVTAADWPTFDLGLQLADVQRQLDEVR